MRRLLALAAGIAALLPTNQLSGTELGLIEAKMRICAAYQKYDDKKASDCFDEVKRALDREQSRLETLQGKQSAALQFLAKHGITAPDIDAKYQVAKRRGVLFAVILSECWNAPGNVAAMEYCLDQREKAETMLGNDLSQP